jgi:transposase InsO family protein
MAIDNPLWGEERIASELLVKLAIRVSPRTVRKYMPERPPGVPRGDQRWSTFLENHAKAIIACDFFVAVTATFRMLYVFVVISHGTRRLAHVNVTANPTAAWTLQQLREAVNEERRPGHLIHDRDRIFSGELDDSIQARGLEVIRTPIASPKANAICERVIGTIRRECLDWMNPAFGGAPAGNTRRVGHSLQHRTSAWRVGSRRAGSAATSSGVAEVQRPPSAGGGRARACQLRVMRLASRILTRDA